MRGLLNDTYRDSFTATCSNVSIPEFDSVNVDPVECRDSKYQREMIAIL